ncbi:hypothetical protein SAMN05892883_2125 [Jatrophihabitans sp. GAS493]|uniref:hypothetical protein n=1 Tax=Jatrophihabitans sp. GAS493 TaxID=1907575 RepID=UPI000BB801A0|nr:hypothetical protein [Jatrophihabitans sp. GAS493]SOD72788.1 hypothetical protein SAMN05892883_2125 [Jatrophihabitans sp. GAS493]
MIDLSGFTAPFHRSSLLQRAAAATRVIILTEINLVNAFRVAQLPPARVDATVYRDLADLFEAIEDDEDASVDRDCDGLRRLADSLDQRPRRLRNSH